MCRIKLLEKNSWFLIVCTPYMKPVRKDGGYFHSLLFYVVNMYYTNVTQCVVNCVVVNQMSMLGPAILPGIHQSAFRWHPHFTGFTNWYFLKMLSCFNMKEYFWRNLSFVCPSSLFFQYPHHSSLYAVNLAAQWQAVPKKSRQASYSQCHCGCSSRRPHCTTQVTSTFTCRPHHTAQITSSFT